MFNSIKSYFKVLTNDELEINELRERQAAGRRRREAVKRKVEVHNITDEVISLVESDDEYIGSISAARRDIEVMSSVDASVDDDDDNNEVDSLSGDCSSCGSSLAEEEEEEEAEVIVPVRPKH